MSPLYGRHLATIGQLDELVRRSQLHPRGWCTGARHVCYCRALPHTLQRPRLCTRLYVELAARQHACVGNQQKGERQMSALRNMCMHSMPQQQLCKMRNKQFARTAAGDDRTVRRTGASISLAASARPQWLVHRGALNLLLPSTSHLAAALAICSPICRASCAKSDPCDG